jgi:hypothetical protein
VLLRIWIVLLAVLLLAAPAGGVTAEVVDGDAAASLCTDEALPHTPVTMAEPPPQPTRCLVNIADTLPPAPPLARIFRPPRTTLA